MFGKLKDKLKSALSIFSRKAEEEAEVKVVEAPKEIVADVKLKEIVPEAKPKAVAPGVKLKEVPPEAKAKEVPKKEEKKVERKKEESKKVAEKKEIIQERKEIPELKKSFLSKLFGKEEAPPKAAKEKKPVEPEKAPEPEKIPAEEKISPSEQPSFFEKIKQAVTTKTISAEKFNELFWDLEIVLLENNVSVEVIDRIKKDLEKELVDKPLPRDVESKILETLKKTLLDILTFEDIDLLGKINEKTNHKKPFVIAFFGINGTGKTTSIAKLTHYFQQHKKSVVLAAGDTFRAAAIQQLEEHADKLGVKMIKHDYGADAAAVAFDAVKYAQKNKVDIVLIDTAGRLHSNANLMQELEKIIRIAKPDLKIFVGESITGNDCIEQARQFNRLVEMDGAILTKADVDEKGGAPLSIAYTIKKPILFLGVGQRYQDLEKFEAVTMVQRLGL